ncbi:MAG: tyrosine-type recombinase/integrase [Pirellulales bacterium]
MRKPYYWAARNAWYVNDGRAKIRLSDNEEEAHTIWADMRSQGQTQPHKVAVAVICEKYLLHVEKNGAPTTLKRYQHYLVDFCLRHGRELARNIRPIQVTEWVDSHTTWKSTTTQRDAIESVKSAFGYAKDQGMLLVNPLVDMKRPGANERESIITAEMHAELFKEAAHRGYNDRGVRRHNTYRIVLIALRHTGGRPQTVSGVTVKDVASDITTWTLDQHKTRKVTGKPLTIFLSPCMQTVTRILLHARGRSGGPLFRNSRGNPWSKDSIGHRFRNLREKLGYDESIVPYSYRHGFATEMLVAGMDATTVAGLMGHTDPGMVLRRYSHVTQKKDYMLQAAKRIASSGPAAGPQ